MSATTDNGTEPVQTEQETEPVQVHPLDEEPTPPAEPEPVPVRRGRGLGLNRHLGSVLLSFLAVLGAYGALDYGFYRAYGDAQEGLDGALPQQTMIALAAAGLCLLVAAAAGRISGLGPLLAGLVLGAAPAALVLLDFPTYVSRLDDVPELWGHTTFGLSYISFALYPVVAGLLIGAAFAGRWRRPPVTT
jgi:hypothetical protein